MTIGERACSSKSFIRLVMALVMFAATLFVMSTFAAAQEQVLYSFENNGTDGTFPLAGLIFDAAGNLYGTTAQGGTSNNGTVFELTLAPGGIWMEKVLWSFGNGTDGVHPYAGLIFDAAGGNLYGTTFDGGTYGAGTVFELSPSGPGWTWRRCCGASATARMGASPRLA